MFKSALKKLGLTTLIASLSLNGYSEDIDIFQGNPALAGTRPNVLIVLDNTANWNTPFTFEKAALKATFGGLNEEFNVGLMMFTESGGGNGTPDGGYMRAGVRNMNATNRTALSGVVENVHILDDKSNGGKLGLTMNEAYLYFKGDTAFAGANKVKRDYTGNVTGGGSPSPSEAASNVVYALPGNALSSAGDRSYNSPINASNNCAKNFIIYISNGPAADNASDTSTATSNLSAAGGLTTEIPITPSGSQDNVADEWARFMFNTDVSSVLPAQQNIISYTIDVLPGSTGQGPGHTALLKSMANVGGGKYFTANDVTALTDALKKIFDEIQAVDSVFASVALPVTVNVRGSFLNQVYMGVFRPDQFAGPRWPGNLKQYKVDFDPATAAVFLSDKNSLKIENSANGFIVPGAESFWTTKNIGVTPDSTGGFWVSDPQGVAGGFDLPDGDRVEKGGAGQHLRKTVLTADYTTTAGLATNPRKLYVFCPSGASCNADLTAASNVFAPTNTAITDALLGATGSVSVSSLTRSGTTVTVTTSGNHGFTSGQNIAISGATQNEYNGTYGVTVVDATHFTYSIASVNPPSPATGSYTASLASGGAQAVTSITRSGTTATVTTTANHGYSTGNPIIIAGAVQPEYNGAKTITVTGVNTFTYTVVEGPVSPAGGGTATVGGVVRSIETWDANPTPGVERVAGSTTVTVKTTANHGFANSGLVTIAGVVDSVGNLVSQYNVTGVSFTKTSNRTFTFVIPALTPVSPATGTITADNGATPKTITSLTRSGTTAIATAAAHGFIDGQTVSVGGTIGTNEGAYVGSFTISNVTANTFDYTVVTSPATPATGSIVATGAGTVDRTTLINWVRGQDNFGDEASPGAPYTVRPSIHGDVLHSSPAVVNYARSTEPANRDIVIYYGGNDGALHAVKGGRDDADGFEKWALIFPEHLPQLNRLRNNVPTISVAAPKPYFVDGALTSLFKDADLDGQLTTGVSGDIAYLYATMRRGGRFLYALDVINQDVPKVLWNKNNTSAGFSELGQTWSDVQLGKVNLRTVSGGALVETDIAIFGGGYDPAAEDALPATANTMGRAIYIVNAATGDIIKSFGPADGLTHAIPSAVRAFDRNGDGYIDRFYVGDTGGNLWRGDLFSGTSDTATGLASSWTLSKIAAVGGTGTDARKFMGAVSVVLDDGTRGYDAILLGSGDREHPFDTTITNRFYMFKDPNTSTDPNVLAGLASPGVALGLTEAVLFDTTANLIQQGDAIQQAAASVSLNAAKGWYITLGVGEKVVGSAVTVLGTTTFGTNRPTPPDPASCASNLGEARLYAINFENGAATSETDNVAGLTTGDRSTKLAGGGLPPSPVAIQVKTDSGVTVTTVCFGPTCEEIKGSGRRNRVYWNMNVDD